MKKITFISAAILVLTIIIYIGLPSLIQRIGIHPEYEDKTTFQLQGKKALVITTSHDKLGEGEDAKPTGVYATEMIIPYYEFLDAGMDVDIASIQGGQIPIEPMSLRWPLKTAEVQRFLNDKDAMKQVDQSYSIEEIDFTAYDLVFLAGGWGAAYDLGTSEKLGEGISTAYASQAIIGAVCHGPLGLLNAVDENGNPLLENLKVTGVTNKQVQELGIEMTPMHPETELIKAGADFQFMTAKKDMLANLTVVDGRIVSGQNQNASSETAQKMMAILSTK
ncbi:MAG: type 1 glutamine amidotransferase domain-containing protein [Anaerolineaceae bacterium]|nr:type 1 glutamine amidotransferase domain-containing protein [Anaerolineaceae bacterium]